MYVGVDTCCVLLLHTNAFEKETKRASVIYIGKERRDDDAVLKKPPPSPPKSSFAIDDSTIKKRTTHTHTHLVVIVDVAHVALGLDAIVAVREYRSRRGLRREEDEDTW